MRIYLPLFLSVLLGMAQSLQACPFCSAVSMTFCEEIAGADAAVIAKLIDLPPQSTDPTQNATAQIKPAKFEIVEVLKGTELIGKTKTFETLYFGQEEVGKLFLVIGMNEKSQIAWATPIVLSAAAPAYLKAALALPKEGPERLAFFQDYLEGGDEVLARDAYDEFAKAPYSMVVALKDQMKHDQLVEWIKNPKVTASHRRLYLTMLGVCGTPKDADMLEKLITEDTKTPKPGMDALIASYLTLKGPAGVPLIEDKFLKNKEAEYTETYAAIMALRFHGQEEAVVPKQRLVEALRQMLTRPQLADLVIPDLARWEDWGSMDTLVQLFKDADDESSWVRVPVVNFLRACPLPEAKERLKELAKIDPESVERANSFFPLGGGAPVPAGTKTEKPAAGDAKAPASDKSTPAKTDTSADETLDEIPDASTFPNKSADTAEPVRVNSGATLVAEGDVDQASFEEPVPPKDPADRGALDPTPLPANPANNATTSTSGVGVMGGLALAGLVLLLIMAAIMRGGQHVTSV